MKLITKTNKKTSTHTRAIKTWYREVYPVQQVFTYVNTVFFIYKKSRFNEKNLGKDRSTSRRKQGYGQRSTEVLKEI